MYYDVLVFFRDAKRKNIDFSFGLGKASSSSGMIDIVVMRCGRQPED
jgi:phosphoglucomutase